MQAHHLGHGPGLAAPDAAASLCAAGAASMVADAVAPAGLNPQKESAPATQAAQSREQNEPSNSATGAGADKAFLTLRAVLAMAGYALSRSDAGDGERTYFVARWGMVRELRTLDDVQRFAQQVGVRNA